MMAMFARTVRAGSRKVRIEAEDEVIRIRLDGRTVVEMSREDAWQLAEAIDEVASSKDDGGSGT